MTEQLVRDIAADALTDAIDMLEIIETLESGNAPVALAAVRAAKTDRVAECIYRALWTRLLVIVARAYADTRPNRPNDRHAHVAFELLKHPATRLAVEKHAGADATALAEAIALWTNNRTDYRLHSIREYRDKFVAHRGQWGAKVPLPIINDIFAVTRATAAAIERLAQGTGIVTLSLDSQLMTYRQRADRFWGI
jgi:AbiU2